MAFIASTITGGTRDLETSAINTTGATLIVLGYSYYNAAPLPTFSDSKGNTWTGLTVRTEGYLSCRLYYCLNPVVGTGHLFETTAGNPDNNYGTLSVAAFSGVEVFDVQNGANATAGALAAGSVTPSGNNAVLVTFLGFESSALPITIDEGFTVAGTVEFVNGTNLGGSLAYLLQTSAAAKNPTWDRTGSDKTVAAIAVFKPTGGGGTASNILSINGLAKASVKTVNGVLLANVKTFNGLG